MELLDLCPLERWKSLEDDIRSRSGLNAGAFSIEGIRLIPPAVWPNRLCPAIKANPKGQAFICATAHMNIANMAKTTGEMVIEECDAGMVKMAVPIFVAQEFVGTVSGCGLLLDDGAVDTYLIGKITGMEEAKLKNLAVGISSMSLEYAQTTGHFIQAQVARIVTAYHEANPRRTRVDVAAETVKAERSR
jgi:ligand-binding sensor protein